MKYSLWRILLYGVRAFRRNIWLSVIAIITMTMTLMTITVFAMGEVVAKQRYEEFNKKIDYLVFLKDEASDTDITTLENQIQTRPEVKELHFVSKDEARNQFDKDFSDVDEFRGIITAENNPLLRMITVKFNDVQQISNFDTFVNQDRFKQLIFFTSYKENSQNIDNYLRVTNFVKIISLAFAIFFTLIALLVILNTIRLTIHSRRDEIEVMRLVGASPGFIRGPFVVEGVLYGTISALVAIILTWAVLNQLQILVNDSFTLGATNLLTDVFGSTLGLNQAGTMSTLLTDLFMLQLGVGIALGTLCSFIAVRRYLKEQ
jgi:cell division transport system permease protein